MGSVVTVLGVTFTIVVVAGVSVMLYRSRLVGYFVGWQCNPRSIWSICEEWRQRLSWLWAPREEKVGLVKAQHPTAQTVPGLYRQAGNTSQQLLHSDSDLRIDAQGAFQRFEAVDRDLHPPLCATSSIIPPQPLRPAPQPRSTPRPRPSPLHATSAAEYIKLQETNPGPLTPPPTFLPRASPGARFFFDSQPSSRSSFPRNGFQPYIPSTIIPDNHQNNSFEYQSNTKDMIDFDQRFNSGQSPDLETTLDDSTKIRYSIQGPVISEYEGKLGQNGPINPIPSYGTYDIMQRNRDEIISPNENDAITQNIMESFYGTQALSRLFQSSQPLSNPMQSEQNREHMQNIEMTSLRNMSNIQDDLINSMGYSSSSQLHGLHRVSEYIQSLPDHIRPISPTENSPSPPPPPPPAPPDPETTNSADGLLRKNGPTTGERIFNALRSVTSQSYIDVTDFYNSILSTGQKVQNLSFSSIIRNPTSEEDQSSVYSFHQNNGHSEDFFADRDGETIIDITGKRRRSDLYSPELNLEAHRTAREVYNSLQDPPASPLLVKGLNQETYSYMSDPCFTRTSEDIFNSLEQRRKSMERLNGIHDFPELDATEVTRRKSSQELFTALEEVQMKRRLSQSLDESYIFAYSGSEFIESSLGSRRNSLGPEPEPPPEESNLQRAVSFESVCSDTSVTLNNLDEAVVGLICIGLEHERWAYRGDCESVVTVSVLEARDLIAHDGRPAQNTFARVCMLPDREAYTQTRLYRRSPSPSYQEKFWFPLDGSPVGKTLLIEVFSMDTITACDATLLGEATVRLGPVLKPSTTTWLPLLRSTLPILQLGELMFSLSYSSTAERLTVVVVKARNLRGATPTPGSFFVKVYLLQQGKKIHKKRTSMKKGEKSPIFNEAIIFNVPAHALMTIQLRLTVAEASSDISTNTKAYSVGHVIVGATTSGRSLAHWQQMFAALRRQVAMWHPLRK